MLVLLCNGRSSYSLAEQIRPRFRSGGVELDSLDNIEHIEEYLSKGIDFDRVVLLEDGLSLDGEDTKESSIRFRLESFINSIEDKLGNVTYVFIARTDKVAKMMYEETLTIQEKCRVILKEGTYPLTFMTRLLTKNLEDLNKGLIYKPREQGIDDTGVSWSVEHGAELTGLSNQLERLEEVEIDGVEEEQDEEIEQDIIDNFDDLFDIELGLSDTESLTENKDFSYNSSLQGEYSSNLGYRFDFEGSEESLDISNTICHLDNKNSIEGQIEGFFDDISSFEEVEEDYEEEDEEDIESEIYTGQDIEFMRTENTYKEETHPYTEVDREEISPYTKMDTKETNPYTPYNKVGTKETSHYTKVDKNIDNPYNKDSIHTLDIKETSSSLIDSTNTSGLDLFMDSDDLEEFEETDTPSKQSLSEETEIQSTTYIRKKGLFRRKESKSANKKQTQKQEQRQEQRQGLKAVLDTYKHRGSSLVVTGTSSSGKSTLVYNMANTLVNMGYSVLIVDMDTVNRTQAFISKQAYEAVHSIDPENASLKQAINSVNGGAGRYVNIVKPALHLLTLGLAGDVIKPEDLAPKQKLPRFASNIRNNYNFIIYDMPFDVAVDYASEITYTADNILISCEFSSHGIMNLMLAMCNIDNEDMEETMFTRSTLCFTKYKDIETILGTKVKSIREVLNRVDTEIEGLLGIEPDYYFSNIDISGVMKYNDEYEYSWLSDKAYTDKSDNQTEYISLLSNILLKNRII